MATREQQVEIDGRRLRLSNLDKVLYPATGTTKGEVIDYYHRIAPVLVPQASAQGVGACLLYTSDAADDCSIV